MTIEHVLVLNRSKLETFHTKYGLHGVCYKIHSDTFLLALHFSWGYQLNDNIIEGFPPNEFQSFLEVY